MNELVFVEFWKNRLRTADEDTKMRIGQSSALRCDKRLFPSNYSSIHHSSDKQRFFVKINVISAADLNVTSQKQSSLVFVRQKIYVDAAIMPLGCSKYTCRSGGQLRSPNIVLREEFAFSDVESVAESIVVAFTCKAPTQLRSHENIIGYAIIPFKDYLDACENTANRNNCSMRFEEVLSTHELLDSKWHPTPGKITLTMLLGYQKL